MARKTAIITIDKPGRDEGKSFVLTEMPAPQGERWAMRAIFALGRSGVEVPPDLVGGGMATIATIGIQALMSLEWADAEPLMDEMMTCVRTLPDPGRPEVVRPMVESDTEEIATLFHLRSEVVALHVGFSLADVIRKLGTLAKLTIANTQNTSMSPEPSEPSSVPDSPLSTS